MKTPKPKTNDTKPILGKCKTSTWISSKRARPKTIIARFRRYQDTYILESSHALSMINQHSYEAVKLDVRDINRDIHRLGIRSL